MHARDGFFFRSDPSFANEVHVQEGAVPGCSEQPEATSPWHPHLHSACIFLALASFALITNEAN